MYQVGFQECDITPALGSIIPGGFAARYNVGVLDRIYTRAVVIGDGTKRIAIACVDCCGLTADICSRIKTRAAQISGILPEAIMVMADHIHAGGPTLNWGEEVVRDEVYLDRLVNATADAIAVASEKAEDHVTLSTASCDVPDIAFIRVYRTTDGGLVTNPSPERKDIVGPYTSADPELRIVLASGNGRPLGAIVNFACHPAIVAGNMTSADYIGVLSRELKEKYGPDFVTVFVNGACGNINHLNIYDACTYTENRHIPTGKRLAEAVSQLISSPMKELSAPLGYASKPVVLGVRRPDEQAFLAAYRHIMDLGDGYIDKTPSTPNYTPTFFAIQAFMRMLDKRNHIDTAVQILDIAGIRLFGFPAQMFVEFGKKVKAVVPNAMVSIFANDYLGYCPVPEAMVPGVYEATLCATSMLAPDSGDRLVDAALRLL